MGYYVRLLEADWVVPENQAVFDALASLNKLDGDLKRGGSWGPGDARTYWFSWMPEDYDTKFTTVAEILDALGFEYQVNEEISIETPYPTISITGYDIKTSQVNLLSEARAPFVKNMSYMNWEGEEGERWIYTVINGHLHMSEGKIVYTDPKPYSPLEAAKHLGKALNVIRNAT